MKPGILPVLMVIFEFTALTSCKQQEKETNPIKEEIITAQAENQLLMTGSNR